MLTCNHVMQANFAGRVHQILISTPRAIIGSARKSLFLSRRAIWSSGRTPLALTLDLPGDVDDLTDACGGGNLSGLEIALRREIAQALDLPMSDVILDSLTSHTAGTTEVCSKQVITYFLLSIRKK